jgi:hypothetical protein
VIVVTFEDFTPIPRYDGNPWASIMIEEAPASNGPWTVLETQAISPIDTDPEHPATRDFTTELATLDAGWYRLTFIDQTGDQQLPTDPIHNVPDVTAPYLPSVGEVANLIAARTKDQFGNELGTFGPNTRPTDNKVLEIIDQAADDVTTILDTDIPESMYEYAEQAIAVKAAAIIERAYYAEQINNNRSPYPQLLEEYEWLVGTPENPGWIIKSLQREEQETGTPELSLGGHYWFPAADPRIELGSNLL